MCADNFSDKILSGQLQQCAKERRTAVGHRKGSGIADNPSVFLVGGVQCGAVWWHGAVCVGWGFGGCL